MPPFTPLDTLADILEGASVPFEAINRDEDHPIDPDGLCEIRLSCGGRFVVAGRKLGYIDPNSALTFDKEDVSAAIQAALRGG